MKVVSKSVEKLQSDLRWSLRELNEPKVIQGGR